MATANDQAFRVNSVEVLSRKSSSGYDPVIVLPSISSAPSVTTNKLYNLNGVLTFDAVNLESPGGSGGTLGEAYQNGRTITTSLGAIVITDSTSSTANTIEVNKTGAGSGNVLDFDLTVAFTGNVLNLDMGSGISAVGIVIDAEGGARTGSDLQFTSDGSGAHSCIDINESGTGAGIGFDWNGTFAGSPAGHVFKVNFDNSANLDTEIMQIDTGTGNRAIMFDYNFAHTDSGTTSHIWDIDLTGVIDSDVFNYATTAACTGNVFFINLDNGVAQTALHVEGSGVRTQPMVEVSTDATGSSNVIELAVSGAISGNLIDVAMSTTSTGNVLDVDMDASVGGKAIYLDSGNAARTAVLVDILHDGTGNADCFNLDHSNTGSGMLFDINVSGVGSGNIVDITYSAASTGDALKVVMADNVAGGALVVTGAGARTDNLIEVTTSETGSVDGIIRVDASGVFTGSVVTLVSSAAATTGSLLHLDLDAGVAYKAITIDHAGARTAASILVTFDGSAGAAAGGTFLDANITMTGAGAAPFIDVDITGVYTGNLLDILIGASAATGTMIKVDLGATATAASAMNLVSGAMLRSVALVKIDDAGTSSGATFDINHTGITTGIIFDIDATAATTGNVFDYATNSASTGTIFEINMTNAVAAKWENVTLAGVRTANASTITESSSGAVDLWQIDDSGTSSGHVWDVNISGVMTGNVLDIVYSVAAATGDAIHVDMGTNLAGNAIQIDAAGIRTAPLINIANTGTDGGTDDHVLLVTQSGLLDSSMVQLTFGTAASTGDAINIIMDTNVAGMGLTISSAGTGVTGEGNCINVSHTGASVAGSDAVRFLSTGSLSSTSNVLAVEQTTGAGTAGAHALYVSATGTNVEAIKVDDGDVVFDESLTVSSKVIFNGSETIVAGGTSTALSLTKTVHYVDADAGGDIFTLADGVAGQIMTILLTSSTGVATVTPTNLAGGTSVTLNADGDSVVLQFFDTEWFCLGGNSYTVVA